MNTELKALLLVALALVKTGKDAVEKADFVSVILPDLYGVASKVPAAFANWSSLAEEIAALDGSEQEKDLAAFLMEHLPEVTDSEKAKKIVAASLKLVIDGVADGMALHAALNS